MVLPPEQPPTLADLAVQHARSYALEAEEGRPKTVTGGDHLPLSLADIGIRKRESAEAQRLGETAGQGERSRPCPPTTPHGACVAS